jgi:aminoglycoside phosphotransferase (APT) family kinase protein
MSQPVRHDGLPESRVQEIAAEVHGATPCTCRSVGWGNNQIWKIEYAGGHDYLKRYVTGVDAYRRELWALTALKGRLPVPEVLLAREDDGTRCPFVLTRGIAGTPLDKVETSREPLVAQMGGMLARLHNLHDQLGPLPSCVAPLPLPSADEFRKAVSPELTAFIDRRDLDVARQSLVKPQRPVLAQRDFGDWQCLVAESRIVGWVDWEAASVSEPEADLAFAGAFLRTFRAPTEEAAFLAGYEQSSRFHPNRELYECLRTVFLVSLHALWRSRGQTFEAERARLALARTDEGA